MQIQIADNNDLNGLLSLYTQLHDNKLPDIDDKLLDIWNDILNDKNHYIFISKEDNKIISSCVMIIVPNLTNNQRPYALIENVVTHEDYRNKGLATAVLEYAKKIAIDKNCYKIMLMTGSKKDSTLNFYRRAGYNSEDKTAFIQWL